MSVILTYQGRDVDLRGDEGNEYAIADIAHALSQICRFGGHCRQFYSVAQHSVMVSKLVSPEYKLQALLHDASEAYLGDIVQPLKTSTIFSGYVRMEEYMMKDIHRAFNINSSVESEKQIRWADLVMLATERRDLMAPSTQNWIILNGIVPMNATISPLMPVAAEALFLKTFKELSGVL